MSIILKSIIHGEVKRRTSLLQGRSFVLPISVFVFLVSSLLLAFSCCGGWRFLLEVVSTFGSKKTSVAYSFRMKVFDWIKVEPEDSSLGSITFRLFRLKDWKYIENFGLVVPTQKSSSVKSDVLRLSTWVWEVDDHWDTSVLAPPTHLRWLPDSPHKTNPFRPSVVFMLFFGRRTRISQH